MVFNLLILMMKHFIPGMVLHSFHASRQNVSNILDEDSITNGSASQSDDCTVVEQTWEYCQHWQQSIPWILETRQEGIINKKFQFFTECSLIPEKQYS